MHYQHLKNFLTNRVRKNDIFVPAMILYLVKNSGVGTTKEIARLMYIFDYRHELEYYETIVEKFTSVILEEYNIIKRENSIFKLNTWPLSDNEITEIIHEASKVSNGFFRNLNKKESVN